MYPLFDYVYARICVCMCVALCIASLHISIIRKKRKICKEFVYILRVDYCQRKCPAIIKLEIKRSLRNSEESK